MDPQCEESSQPGFKDAGLDFPALYEKHKDAMYRVAHRLLRGDDQHRAEDIAQEAVLSVWRNPPKVVQSWEALFVQVVKRKVYDLWKSSAHEHERLVFEEARPLDNALGGDELGVDPAQVIEDALDRASDIARVQSPVPTRPGGLAGCRCLLAGQGPRADIGRSRCGDGNIRLEGEAARDEGTRSVDRHSERERRWAMSGDEFRERDELMEILLETPAGPERDRRLAELDEETRATFEQLLEVDELVWESDHGAPPLENDPVAAMLGLVPDPSFRLDSTAFMQHCSRSKVKPMRLAERLRARGWQVDAADVFRWQMSVASEVSPALIGAIAEEIRTTPDKLATHPSAQQGALDALADLVAATKRFGDLAQRFAHAQRISPSMAQSVLRTRVPATAQRGREPEVEQMLESLEALVRALEAE